MAEPPVYKLMSKRCGECLTTRNRIVSGARAAELVRECRQDHIKFICHKTKDVACRGVHEISPCMAYRFAVAVGIEVVEIDPEGLEGAI